MCKLIHNKGTKNHLKLLFAVEDNVAFEALIHLFCLMKLDMYFQIVFSVIRFTEFDKKLSTEVKNLNQMSNGVTHST